VNGVSTNTASGAYTDINRGISALDHPRPKVSISERPSVRVASVDCSVDMPMNIYGWRVAGGALTALLLIQGPLRPVQVPTVG
jgi:hypothetical protein